MDASQRSTVSLVLPPSHSRFTQSPSRSVVVNGFCAALGTVHMGDSFVFDSVEEDLSDSGIDRAAGAVGENLILYVNMSGRSITKISWPEEYHSCEKEAVPILYRSDGLDKPHLVADINIKYHHSFSSCILTKQSDDPAQRFHLTLFRLFRCSARLAGPPQLGSSRSSTITAGELLDKTIETSE